MKNLLASLLLASLFACSGSDNNKDAGPTDSGGGGGGGGGSDGGACSLVANWRGTVPAGPFAGQTNNWAVKAGGTTTGVIGTATINGTWALDAGTLSLTDTSSTPPSIACPSAQVGTYTFVFADDCNTVTFHAVSDACDGRRLPLDTFAPTLSTFM